MLLAFASLSWGAESEQQEIGPPLILRGFGDRACIRLIVAHLGTHRNSKAVPGVDGGLGKHRRNQLRFKRMNAVYASVFKAPRPARVTIKSL
jgi:hypothetical protein